MTPQEIRALPYRPCVGIMLVNAQGRVFTGTRVDRDTLAWQMPQGGIDPGETPQVAALRELEEETGVTPDLVTLETMTDTPIPYDLPHDIVPKIWKGRFRGQAQYWALIRFHGADTDINIATKHPEFSQWRWSDPADLVPNIVPFKRDVYAKVMEQFGGMI